jgi:hypothetical protein
MNLFKAIRASTHHFKIIIFPNLLIILVKSIYNTNIAPADEVANRFSFKSTVKHVISIPK